MKIIFLAKHCGVPGFLANHIFLKMAENEQWKKIYENDYEISHKYQRNSVVSVVEKWTRNWFLLFVNFLIK
jgi:hypothetical protein